MHFNSILLPNDWYLYQICWHCRRGRSKGIWVVLLGLPLVCCVIFEVVFYVTFLSGPQTFICTVRVDRPEHCLNPLRTCKLVFRNGKQESQYGPSPQLHVHDHPWSWYSTLGKNVGIWSSHKTLYMQLGAWILTTELMPDKKWTEKISVIGILCYSSLLFPMWHTVSLFRWYSFLLMALPHAVWCWESPEPCWLPCLHSSLVDRVGAGQPWTRLWAPACSELGRISGTLSCLAQQVSMSASLILTLCA